MSCMMKRMLRRRISLWWSASDFSSSDTYSHVVSIISCAILERIVVTPLIFIIRICFPWAHQFVLIYLLPECTGWISCASGEQFSHGLNHRCERRKTKVLFIMRKNNTMNRRAKELMALSTGDKFLILCSADVCCIFRPEWLWFKTLLI